MDEDHNITLFRFTCIKALGKTTAKNFPEKFGEEWE